MSNIINAQNPFFGQYLTPHETVPFDRIKTEHYEPAILEGIKQQNAEINAIIHNPEKADFRNTIERKTLCTCKRGIQPKRKLTAQSGRK